MRIGVIGGGAWGTALAQVAAQGGEPVLLWAREPEVVDAINRDHENPLFLPGVALIARDPGDRSISPIWRRAISLLVVTPAQHMRAVLSRHARSAPRRWSVRQGHRGRHDGADPRSPRPGAPMRRSRCSPARPSRSEVPRACRRRLRSPAPTRRGAASGQTHRPARFPPYRSTDVVGAEIGGAVKNVLAIACGVVEGAGLGQNARAALIARGFAEMTRFGLARGARAETLAGLSGLGDLVLTCSSDQSRNFSLGVGLGQGTAPRVAGRSPHGRGGRVHRAGAGGGPPIWIG
jgi:glycerol-3-phosphate dehydrogenase (NAD(P)+)